MINPINEFVIVKVLEEKEESAILTPATHHKQEYGAGTVVAAEEDLGIVEGDTVFFDKLLLTCVKIKGEELRFIKYSDILGYERVTETGVSFES